MKAGRTKAEIVVAMIGGILGIVLGAVWAIGLIFIAVATRWIQANGGVAPLHGLRFWLSETAASVSIFTMGAVLIAHARRANRRFPSGTCAKCGYDLRATSNVCPECGTKVTLAGPK